MQDYFVPKARLREFVPYSPDHAMRLAKCGRFPTPMRLGENSRKVGWMASQLRQFIEQNRAA